MKKTRYREIKVEGKKKRIKNWKWEEKEREAEAKNGDRESKVEEKIEKNDDMKRVWR